MQLTTVHWLLLFLNNFPFPAISIRTLGRKFDVDILPSGGIKILLQNLGLENFRLRRLKVRGQINMADGNYELVFSG